MMKRVTLALVLVAICAGIAAAQDTSVLRPPKGEKLAIIAFEDLQCPDCAAAEPLLLEASAKYKIPLVRRDFPLPAHVWAFDAHVIARYFDTVSPQTGEEFRRWVYENQKSINRTNLRGMAERFAEEHKLTLPEKVDPKGVLAKQVWNAFQQAQELNIQHTPTVFVVSDTQRSAAVVENLERESLFELIEKMQGADKK
jgi:protein-disulfide isomerase